MLHVALCPWLQTVQSQPQQARTRCQKHRSKPYNVLLLMARCPRCSLSGAGLRLVRCLYYRDRISTSGTNSASRPRCALSLAMLLRLSTYALVTLTLYFLIKRYGIF